MTDGSETAFAHGRCACGTISYSLSSAPYVVQCCHCTDCQRERGTAFAVNAAIESDRLTVVGPDPVMIELATASGAGQTVAHCPQCQTGLWSHYGGVGPKASFIHAGTLDDPALCPPSVHLFTRSKQAFVILPEDAEAFPAFYSGRDIPRIYGEEGAARFRALRGK